MNTYKRLQIPLQPATKTSTNKNIFGSSVLQQTDDTIKIVIQAQNLSHSETFKAYAIVSHNGQYIGIHLGNLTIKGNSSELKKEYTRTIDNTIYTINDIVAITVELDGKYNNLTLLVGYPKGYVNCINNYSTNVRNMTTLKPTTNLTSSSTTTATTSTTYTSPIPTLYGTPHHTSHSATTTHDNHHDHHHTSHVPTTTHDHHHDHHHTSHVPTTTTHDHHHDHHHTTHAPTTTTHDHHHDHHHTSHSTTTTHDHHHHDHHHSNIGNSPTLSKQATKATTNDFYNELLSEPTQETTLETVITKLKEELNSLKELSTATKDDLHKQNKEFIKQSKINTQENMNFMLKNNEIIKPFTQQNKDINWVVIHTNELVILHKDYWQLFWDDFVCDCYNTHGHLIFGNYLEDDLQYYVLGVPTHYDPKQVRTAQNLGFFQFKPCDNTDTSDDVFGYWLLQIKY